MPENGLQPERNKWRERIAATLLIALAATVCAGIWWQRYTGTPEYSLSQLGKAVRDKNYGKASQYVDEEKIAQAISQSLTDVLVAKYTKKFQEDPLPFTETRIEWLHKFASEISGLVADRHAERNPYLTERQWDTDWLIGIQAAGCA